MKAESKVEAVALAEDIMLAGEVFNRHTELAKEQGLIIVYGHSDDCIELDGAIYDEVYGEEKYYINTEGVVKNYCDNEAACPNFDDVGLETIWIQGTYGASSEYTGWSFETNVKDVVKLFVIVDSITSHFLIFHKDDIPYASLSEVPAMGILPKEWSEADIKLVKEAIKKHYDATSDADKQEIVDFADSLSLTKNYRKKPVVIQAVLWDGTNEAWEAIKELSSEGTRNLYPPNPDPIIRTLEGDMRANKGDYIIKGLEGELYPCKPGIFKKTYDTV